MTCAVVAVSSGPGISELFGELGVQAVVTGGQTLNPSTAELLAAVERVNADQVVVLPGNKNIIPVAEQLDALTTRTVRVVPTRSMPEGLAALMVYDPEAHGRGQHGGDAPRRRGDRRRRGHPGRAGQPDRRRSGRRGRLAGHRPRRRHRRRRARRRSAPSRRCSTASSTSDRELVTVITGADADEATTASIEAWMAVNRPGVEVEVHDGGQPLYPYLFGVE